MGWMTFEKVLSRAVGRSIGPSGWPTRANRPLIPLPIYVSKWIYFHYPDITSPEVLYSFCRLKTGILRAMNAMACNGVQQMQ